MTDKQIDDRAQTILSLVFDRCTLRDGEHSNGLFSEVRSELVEAMSEALNFNKNQYADKCLQLIYERDQHDALLCALRSDAAGLPITTLLMQAANVCHDRGGGPLEDRLRLMSEALTPYVCVDKANASNERRRSRTVNALVGLLVSRCGKET